MLLAAAAGAVVVFGALGGVQYRLDAFAAFRWHAAALSILAAAAALWPTRAPALAVCAPIVILGGPILAAHWSFADTAASSALASAREQAPAGGSFRLMSFNTWDEIDNIDAVHALLQRTMPDVAVLVEVSPPKRALLEALKPLYPYQVECAERWPCSMALVSRIPFEAQGTVMPNASRPSAVWARIADGGDGVTIVGVHIHRPTRSPRIHFGHMHGLAEIVRATRGNVVVAGDFNTPSWAASMTELSAQEGLLQMPRIVPTWPSWPVSAPQFPIDHILVSRGLRLVDLATEAAAGSDHLPLVGTIVTPRPLRR